MTPEAKVKQKVVDRLKELGVYYFFPVANPMYGTRGVPDIVACMAGRFIAIECKAAGNVLTELQKRNFELIEKNFGVALECNDINLAEVLGTLSSLASNPWLIPKT